ncbi:hypothetical protein DL93DRAFT_2167521 [Clavulina sp. PMI_390]|nr:hypothetical protein DL93DRAFT_2167521 [Clavulina sp. PMI_390]
MAVASSQLIPSNTRSFHEIVPPELASEIVSHFDWEDLKSHSLCSALSHELSMRYLWRAVAVISRPSNGERLIDFIEFFLARPKYAALARAISFHTYHMYLGAPLWEDLQATPANVQGWTRFRATLALFKNVQSVKLFSMEEYPYQVKREMLLPLFSKEFYAALAEAPFSTSIIRFYFKGPSACATQLLSAFRNISCILIPPLESFPETDQPTLSHLKLRQARSSFDLLSVLNDRDHLEHWDEINAKAVNYGNLEGSGSVLRTYRSLRKLHLELSTGEPWTPMGNSPLLASLRHPSLQEVEVYLYNSDEQFVPALQVFAYLVPPNALLDFPSLTYLHIILDQKLPDELVDLFMNPASDELQAAAKPKHIEQFKIAMHEVIVNAQCSELLKEIHISLSDSDRYPQFVLDLIAHKAKDGEWGISISHASRSPQEFLRLSSEPLAIG